MTRTGIINIGAIATGIIEKPTISTPAVLIEGGRIRSLNPSAADLTNAERTIDAGGMTLTPGLFDSHVHPVFGDYSPRLTAVGWIESYLQGGITSMISTGELHLAGRPHDPEGVKALSILAAKSFNNARPSGVKVTAGTLVLESGLVEDDFAQVAKAGARAVKFIESIEHRSEAIQFSRWARKHGLRVIIHCGGTSLPTVPTTTAETIMAIEPDVLAHLNGGPTALSFGDIDTLIRKTSCTIDVIRFGNLRALLQIMNTVKELGGEKRVILGTDSPTGSGMEPLGILHQMTFLCALASIKPEEAIAMATGNTASAYGLATGRVEEGMPADLVLMDAPLGSAAASAFDSMSLGDIPAVALVMIDGDIKVLKSRNTPPTQKPIRVTGDSR